ncbi:MAG: hypothetical protein QY316_12115 [Thermodesulfobacteriota bacterium]|nr:MAG: hypothetical protein QY316_12115 [Thermodesulfobacteriota bacterium]
MKVKTLIFSALLLLLASAWPDETPAFEYAIDFETGDTSQVGYEHNPSRNSIVASDLSGGGNYAFRCMIPQGASQQYCGFNVDLSMMPSRDNVYIRYYVKFEPSWKFATDNVYYKSLILEVDAENYNAGGRMFLNLNSESESVASLKALIYTLDQWHDTGVDIRNDGRWHCIELRSYRNLASPSSGRVQVWHNGTLVLDLNPFNAGDSEVSYITFGYRNGTAQNDMYMQFDEIVIADHYIGPIGVPSPPRNIRLAP